MLDLKYYFDYKSIIHRQCSKKLFHVFSQGDIFTVVCRLLVVRDRINMFNPNPQTLYVIYARSISKNDFDVIDITLLKHVKS